MKAPSNCASSLMVPRRLGSAICLASRGCRPSGSKMKGLERRITKSAKPRVNRVPIRRPSLPSRAISIARSRSDSRTLREHHLALGQICSNIHFHFRSAETGHTEMLEAFLAGKESRWRWLRGSAVFPFIKVFEIAGARRVADHFLGLVGEFPHDLKQLPLAPDRYVEVYAGKQERQTVVAPLTDFPTKLMQAGHRLRMGWMATHNDCSMQMR